MKHFASQSGQATTEFILVASTVLFMLGIVSFNSKKLCEVNSVSDSEECASIAIVFEKVISRNIEEITSIVNLPW